MVKLRNDWEQVLVGISKMPDEEQLESMLAKQLEQSKQFESTMNLYKNDVIHNGQPPNDPNLQTVEGVRAVAFRAVFFAVALVPEPNPTYKRRRRRPQRSLLFFCGR